jgi:integron integrase
MDTKQSIDLLRKSIRLRHLSCSTEQTYVYWCVQFFRFLRTVDPAISSERKIEQWLTSLALRDVSASTQNQAFNAVLYFYRQCLRVALKDISALRAKRGQRVRRAPSVDEVRRMLAALVDADGYSTTLVVKLLYGCGLRVSEPLNLRVRDVDLDGSRLTIRGSKGDKDRVVHLPCSLAEPMRAQIAAALVVWQADRANGLPVKLPNRIAQKYPAAQFSRQWAYVFPLRKPCRDPRDEKLVRYRMLDSAVQRAVRRACVAAGVEIMPHELRHAYATHCLNRGHNPRAIQIAMGHAHLETTMGYLHAEALSVHSPLDAF